MQRLDAPENGARGLAGELLVRDGFDQCLKRRLSPVRPKPTRPDATDEPAQRFVGRRKVFNGLLVHGCATDVASSREGGQGQSMERSRLARGLPLPAA